MMPDTKKWEIRYKIAGEPAMVDEETDGVEAVGRLADVMKFARLEYAKLISPTGRELVRHVPPPT